MGYGARFKSKEELAAAEPEGPPPLVIEEGSRQDTLGQFFDSIDCYIGNNVTLALHTHPLSISSA